MIRVLKPSYALFYLFCHVVSNIVFCFRNRREIYIIPGMRPLAWAGLINALIGVGFVLGGTGFIILALSVNIGLGLGVLFLSPALTFAGLMINAMAAMLIGSLVDENNKASLIRLRKQHTVIQFALRLAHLKIQNRDVVDSRDPARTIFARVLNTGSAIQVELPEGPQYFEEWQESGSRPSFSTGYGFDYRKIDICYDFDLLIYGSPGKRIVLERVWVYLCNRLHHPFVRPQIGLGGMFLQRGAEMSNGYGLLALSDYFELVERVDSGEDKKETSFPIRVILESYDPDVPVSYVKAIHEPVPYSWDYMTDKAKSDSRWTVYFTRAAAAKENARLNRWNPILKP